MTYNGLDIFEGKIKSNDEGILAISLVDDPAIDIDFVCFSKDKNIVNFSIQSEEERIITGPIMIPDYPIIRNVDGYSFYVKYSRETIKEMAEKMLKDGTSNNVDTQHNMQFIDGLSLIELYIKDSKKGIVPSFLQNIPDGTLIASYHIQDDTLWDSVKNGKLLNGFSLAGAFDFEGLKNKIIKNKKMKVIEKFLKTVVKFAQISTDKGILLTNEGEDLAVGVEVFVGRVILRSEDRRGGRRAVSTGGGGAATETVGRGAAAEIAIGCAVAPLVMLLCGGGILLLLHAAHVVLRLLFLALGFQRRADVKVVIIDPRAVPATIEIHPRAEIVGRAIIREGLLHPRRRTRVVLHRDGINSRVGRRIRIHERRLLAGLRGSIRIQHTRPAS